MRVAIVDDEKSEQLIIQKYIHEWAIAKKILMETVCFDSPKAFLFQWEEDQQFELLVLDIEMGEMNGIELAKKVRETDEEISILFASGYDEYMQYGYDVSAIHYLVKPVNKEKLCKVLDKLGKEKKAEEKLFLETSQGKISLTVDKIWYVEAVGHQCIVHTESEDITIKDSISSFAQKVARMPNFEKCHRSFLVNMTHVSAVLKMELVLDHGEKIPLSRNCVKKVNETFIRYYVR